MKEGLPVLKFCGCIIDIYTWRYKDWRSSPIPLGQKECLIKEKKAKTTKSSL